MRQSNRVPGLSHMAYTPYGGSAGRVRVGSGDTAVAGLTSWKLSKKMETVKTTHFETTTDANGFIHETHVKGLVGTTGSCSGLYDGDAVNSEDIFTIGASLSLDLLFDKTSSAGFTNVAVTVTGFDPEHDLRDAGKFAVTFEVNGVAPAS